MKKRGKVCDSSMKGAKGACCELSRDRESGVWLLSGMKEQTSIDMGDAIAANGSADVVLSEVGEF